MKKQPFSLVLVLACTLGALTLGFFLGRNQNHAVLELSQLPTQPRHQVSVTLPPSSASPEVVFPLDLNAAALWELTALPGIGETLAWRILDYRNLHGNFSRPEELLNVEGIGPGKLEAILNYVTTGG